jgi:hypothetical protein
MDAFNQKSTGKHGHNGTVSMRDVIKREEIAEGYTSPPPSSPSKRKSSMPTTPTSSSPAGGKRIKKESSTPGTPPRAPMNGGSKWAGWEDALILEAMLSVAEKGVPWKDLTTQINEKRGEEVSRTVNSVQKHWNHSLKKKIMSLGGDI